MTERRIRIGTVRDKRKNGVQKELGRQLAWARANHNTLIYSHNISLFAPMAALPMLFSSENVPD